MLDIRLVEMHREAHLVSLEQRRLIQLLGLMYIYKDFTNVRRVFARNTRQGNRYNFCIENYQGTKYKTSPFYKVSLYWDTLPDDIIRIPTLAEFKTKLKGIYSPYSDVFY